MSLRFFKIGRLSDNRETREIIKGIGVYNAVQCLCERQFRIIVRAQPRSPTCCLATEATIHISIATVVSTNAALWLQVGIEGYTVEIDCQGR